jgi:hypothetical protein
VQEYWENGILEYWKTGIKVSSDHWFNIPIFQLGKAIEVHGGIKEKV